jgi:hypothetical protein
VAPLTVGRNYDQAAVQLRASRSSEQTKFLLKSSLTVGRYFNAGIRPGVSFERHLLWIRDEFLNSRGKILVHGHTPTEESPKCSRIGSILIPARSQPDG